MYRYLACALALTAAAIAVTPGLAAQATPNFSSRRPQDLHRAVRLRRNHLLGHDDAERGQRRRVRTDGH